MLSNKFNVVYTGLQEGISAEQFIDKFCSKFGISEQKAQKIVNSNSDVVVKKDQDKKKAAQYRAAFESCGMIIRLDELAAAVPEAGNGLSLEPISSVAADSANSADVLRCPKCGSDQLKDDQCQACGIYISKYLEAKKSIVITDEGEGEATNNHTTAVNNSTAVVDNKAAAVDKRPAVVANTAADDTKYVENDEPTEQFDATNINNPYQTPEADLSDPGEHDLEPQKVSAGSGFYWLKRGFWHFKQNPLAWVGSIVILTVLSILVALVPFVGMLIMNLFMPVIMAGFILGSHEQQEGGDFRISHLFSGFSSNVGQLVLVGLMYLLGMVLIGGSFGLIMGGTIAAAGMSPGMGPDAIMNLVGPGMLIFMLLAFVFMTLLIMAYYYAPALIALDDVSAMQAMKLSLKACLKNWLAFTVYGLIAIIVFIIAAIPVFLGYLIAIPMLQASIYVSYRDIFYHERS